MNVKKPRDACDAYAPDSRVTITMGGDDMKRSNILKRMIAFAACLAVALSLMACDKKIPHPTHSSTEPQASTQNTQTQTQPETTAAEDPEMTLEQFIEKTEGIWIIDSTINHMYDDEYCFEVLIISADSCGTAVYPGGFDRPGKINAFEVVEENVFRLSLLYEAGEFMGDNLPEARDTLTITATEEGKIKAQYSDTDEYSMIFGGKDFAEANAAAAAWMKDQKP